jgi:hypothetical protein
VFSLACAVISHQPVVASRPTGFHLNPTESYAGSGAGQGELAREM